jgi:beta-lactamase class D
MGMNLQWLRGAVLVAVVWLACAATAQAGPCHATRDIDIARYAELIGSRRVAFLALDTGTNVCQAVDRAGTDIRQTPWSSFDIPQLLIALETGAGSLDQPVAWDSKRRPKAAYWPSEWAEAQTLRSAFERSTPWYFQELAPRVGSGRYREWLRRFGYGNAKVADGSDAFWLDGSLKVSPAEQVDFFSRLLNQQLGVSAASLATLEEVALIDQLQGHALFGKAGAGAVVPGKLDGLFDGWMVGYVRRPEGRAPVVFALYVRGPGFASIRQFRQQAAMQLLADIGAWPAGPAR